MKSENRIIAAMAWTGVSDIVLGIVMMLTGWHVWYYDHFHFFGVVGISSLFYAYWHSYFLRLDTKGEKNGHNRD